jgi:hemerythrin-like domain-containing protein
MKRSPELRDLSVDHHHGLVAARELRWAAEGKVPLPAALAGFLRAWQQTIAAHFRREEEVLLPGFARAVAADDPLIVRTLVEHVALRRTVRDLAESVGERRRVLAGEIGRALDDHIRFEERVLFPAIEQALGAAELARLGEELRARK